MGTDYDVARAWEAAQEASESVNALLEEREQRLAAAPQREEWTAPASEAPQPITRAPTPRERTAAHPGIDWDKTRIWVEGLIAKHTGATGKVMNELAEALGTELGNITAKMDRDLKDQLRGFEQRVQALEARLFELALRSGQGAVPPEPAVKPEPPRLVGFSDAAD